MRKILAPIILVIVGVLGAVGLVRSKTPVETTRPVLEDPLVRVVQARKETLALGVSAQGTVLPRTETTLAAQVAAQVVSTSPHFEAGEFFERGEVLVRLDQRDYELEVERASALVAQAELRLAQQQAEAQVAEAEWQELGQGTPDPLVLREPQMAEARAMLRAAEAELGMARLALERTQIRAPFDGRVHSKAVDLGQYLTPGQAVATIHAIDYAEVRLPVPDRQLAFLDLPLTFRNGTSGSGLDATLSARFSGRQQRWHGQVVRTEGELDRRSRMLNLVVRVEDPYGRRQPGKTPLAVGLFVDAEIAGRTVSGFLLPRSALRGESQALVVDEEDRLRIRDVEVVRVDREMVVVGDGLLAGERVCVSPLDTVVDGMRVRTLDVEGPAAAPRSPQMSPPTDSESLPQLATQQTESAELTVASHTVKPPTAPQPEATSSPAPIDGRLLAIQTNDGATGDSFIVRVGGEFSVATSRLRSPDRFVIDLLGVVKANPRSAIEIADGSVERIRIGQYQAEPEPIARLVFDLRQDGEPAIEHGEDGLTVRF
ncbi:MAG: efflux RND transporter periplasmic adaptor subunit [Acidobacteriota bacterium]